jgi:hypothetical protein
MKRINVSLGDNFPEFKRKSWFRKRFPLNRPRDIISTILAYVVITLPILGEITIGTILYVAVIGYSVWTMFSSKAGGTGMPPVDQNGQLVNTRQSSKTLPVVYGVARVGGNWVFSRPSGDINNNVLNVVITWSEGEIQGVASGVDFTPLFTGAGVNDIHTGGDFMFPGITQVIGAGSLGYWEWFDEPGSA